MRNLPRVALKHHNMAQTLYIPYDGDVIKAAAWPTISRRDFLNGTALAIAAGLTPAAQIAAQTAAQILGAIRRR